MAIIPESRKLPKDFGKGWLTKSAEQELRIAIGIGGFPKKETILAVLRASKKSKNLTNKRTVDNVLYEIRRKYS